MSLNAVSVLFSTKLLPLIFAFVGFGLLITIHEFGHFIFCKIFKVSTPTFSIGMGPTLFKKQIGATNFRIAALPIGGYVEIAGLAEVGQGEQSSATDRGETSFSSKKYWQKASILLGGIIFNLLFAYLVFSAMFWIGIPKQKAELLISTKAETALFDKFGLKTGDKILSIKKEALNSDPKALAKQLNENFLAHFMKNETSEQIPLEILRNQEKISVVLSPKPTDTENEILLNSLEFKTEQVEGQYEKYSFFNAIKHGISSTNKWICNIILGIKYLITEKTLKGAGGPIMILSQTFKTAQRGIIPLLIFLAIISINLAILNILPIGALDGGQLLFATIEAIIRREIPEMVRLVINLASWILILSLILYLSYKDILRIFTGR
jgi:regulator of sigma E protease